LWERYDGFGFGIPVSLFLYDISVYE